MNADKDLAEAIQGTPLSIFNDLVREAYNAQEAFDQWDEGKTVGGFVVGGQRTGREVSLKKVCDEWDAANLALVRHIAEHGPHLLKTLQRK